MTTPEYKKVALLHVGMTRQEVIASLGAPVKTVRNGSLEILSFNLNDTKPKTFAPSQKTAHYVVISRGRVESFGKD